MPDLPNDEMEKLQKKRAELESGLATVRKDRNTLEQETKVLGEKVAIWELEEKLKEEQDAVARLTFEKKELEDKMKGPSKFSVSEAIQKTKEKEEKKVIWRKDESTPESDEKPEAESKEPPEEEDGKKKLRFF
jgi:hypothetical protein